MPVKLLKLLARVGDSEWGKHQLLVYLESYIRLPQPLVEWLIVYFSEGRNDQGGFRNLLLDGWWLEFWEIILLAAGNVERNPGPR